MHHQRGFTILELLVVVGIITVLSAIGYPAYTKQMLKSHRVEAVAGINQLVQLQERFKVKNFRYANSFSDLYSGGSGSGPLAVGFVTDGGRYNISMTSNDGYTVTARATGAQAEDTECEQMIMNSSGERSVVANGVRYTAASGAKFRRCWGE